MNKHERTMLHMTLQQIAEEATQRISEELNKPDVHLWRSREIITGIVNSYIPKTTFKRMGIAVNAECVGGKNGGVPQTVCLRIVLRKTHPFYHDMGDSRSGRQTTASLFEVSRKREGKELRFRSLNVYEKRLKDKTLVEHCDQNAQFIIHMQKSIHRAAQTLLDAHNALGQEKLKEILNAAKHLEARHKDIFFDKQQGGWRSCDWSSKEDLIMASGLRSRTQRILKGATEGTHVKPAGIVLESDYAPYQNNPLNHSVARFELDLDDDPSCAMANIEKGGPTIDDVAGIKAEYPFGTRLQLIKMDDPYAPVPSGTCGAVDLVDDVGTIHMRWDNGRTLGIVPGVDSFRKILLNDEELERLWLEFGDVPMDPETEKMEDRFLHFPAGTHREEIWGWFDLLYSKGVRALMYAE